MRPSGLAMVGRGRGAEGREGVVGLHVCQKPQAEQGREALNQALGPSGKAAFVHQVRSGQPEVALALLSKLCSLQAQPRQNNQVLFARATDYSPWNEHLQESSSDIF